MDRVKLVKDNMKLVYFIAGRFANMYSDVESTDFEGPANEGLWFAARRYDVSFGVPFGSYASQCIKFSCISFLKENHLLAKRGEVLSAENVTRRIEHYKARNGNKDVKITDEVLKEIGVSRYRYDGAKAFGAAGIVWVDGLTHDDGSDVIDPWTRFFPSVDLGEVVEEDLESERLWAEVEGLVDVYNGDRVRDVLKLYFADDWTHSEIGPIFGVGHERIRQVKARGLKLLKNRLNGSLRSVL